MVQLEIFANRTTRWGGRKGLRFAVRVGREMRHAITGFVIRHTQQLPVTVSLKKLQRSRANQIYPVNVNGCRKVGLTFKKYFILMNFGDILQNIQITLGDSSLSREQFLNVIRGQNIF